MMGLEGSGSIVMIIMSTITLGFALWIVHKMYNL